MKTLSFGTDGIRGHADHYPFTHDALHRLGKALGLWAAAKYENIRNHILIGSDTRLSAERIKQALMSGLSSFPFVILDGDVIPTPAVYQLLKHDNRYAFGIMISASHNPYHDNGIKIFDAVQGKLLSVDEQAIIAHFESLVQHMDSYGSGKEKINWPLAKYAYRQHIQRFFPAHFLKGIKIVIDCAHGATAFVAPELFAQFGADVIVLSAEPDGKNINDACGSLFPQQVQQKVIACNADIGFAFDGDGDRIVVVNKRGVIKDGDDILMLLAQLPCYENLSHVVGTVMTNSGLEYALKAYNKELIRTAVGDKYVVTKLEELSLPLGGEPSGHIIVHDYLSTSDALFVALKVLEAIIATDNWEIKSFEKFPQFLHNMHVAAKYDLSCAPYAELIASHQSLLRQGRLLVRYSGTENVLRIMAEAECYDDAYKVVQELAQKLQELFEHHHKA